MKECNTINALYIFTGGAVVVNEDFEKGPNINNNNSTNEDINNTAKDKYTKGESKRPMVKIVVLVLVVAAIFGIWAYKNLLPGNKAQEYDTSEFALDATEDFDLEQILSHGLPVMIDFGADYCAPCREMEPILEKVNKDYRGRAVIKFVDVQKNPQVAGGFGIKFIPTQFFFDAEGKPYGYHEGFLPEEEIIRILKELGAE